uniref:F-box associated domain-containing protein n=1 Tax=Oryza punctata TaxID=4537 RepID=A0A0E0KHA2_ORYPU
MALDHCNGLLVLESGYVVNPATKSSIQETASGAGEFCVAAIAARLERLLIKNKGVRRGTMADVASVRDTHYAAYWRGMLYIHCQSNFIMRLSMSDNRYRIINRPVDAEARTFSSHYLGKSKKGMYFASLSNDRLLVWLLDEPCGDMKWVLMHQTDLGPSLANNRWLFRKGREPLTLMRENFEWNSDDDTVNDVKDTVERKYYDEYALILGFHPYKEILFIESMDRGYAYHLSSSKFEELGRLHPVNLHTIPNEHLDVELSFPYTPCWIEEFPEPELD